MPRWPGSSAATMEDDSETEAPRAAARVLSAREADKLRDDLITLIQDAGDYLDYALSHLNAAGAECDAWAFDEEEAGTLADVWLSRARKSVAAAQFVRYVISQWNYVQVAAMLGGRFIDTVAFVADNGGLVAPAFMSDRMRFGARGRRGSASSAQASTPPPTPTPSGKVFTTPPPTPTPSHAAAEAAQRAHAARVAALRDGSGAAADTVAATRPDGAPDAPPAPVVAEALEADPLEADAPEGISA